MRWDDRAGTRADTRFHLREIDVARDKIAIDEDRGCADLDDHVEDGEKALRARDHFIAGPDLGELQRDLDRGRRRIQRPNRTAVAKSRELGLECLDPGPAGDVAGAQNVGDLGDRLLVEQRTREFEERHIRHAIAYVRATSHTPMMMKPIPSQRASVTSSPSR